MQKRVTLSLDSEIYSKFQKICSQEDIIVSKRVDKLMKEETEFILKHSRGKK